MSDLYDRALGYRDEKAEVDAELDEHRVVVKKAVAGDSAQYVIDISQKMVAASKGGLCPTLHHAMRPLKQPKRTQNTLVRDLTGRQTANKEEQARAYKQFLAVRGRGELCTFKDHIIADRRAAAEAADVPTSKKSKGVAAAQMQVKFAFKY